jgi:transposase
VLDTFMRRDGKRGRMCRAPVRKPYPSDVSDEEWSLVVTYLTLMTEAPPQRDHSSRESFNVLRYVIHYGIAWRAMPNDFPPWAAVYQHSSAGGSVATLGGKYNHVQAAPW